MALKITITESAALDEQLAKVAAHFRLRVMKTAVRKACNVIRNAARARAPRSKRTGTRKKWSRELKAARASVPQFADEIKVVVRDYGPKIVGVIGAEAGSNLSHLIEDGFRLTAWGQPTDIVVAGNPVLEPAADESAPQAMRVLSDTVVAEVKRYSPS